MNTKRKPARFRPSGPAGDKSAGGGFVRPHYSTTAPRFQAVTTLSELAWLARWRAIRAADRGNYTRAALHLDLFYQLRRQRGIRERRR